MEDDRQQESEGAGPERADDARRRLREDLETLRAQVTEMLAGEEEAAAQPDVSADPGAELRRELAGMRDDLERGLGGVRSDLERGFTSMRLAAEIAEARHLRDDIDRMLSGLVRDLRDVADRIARQ